MSVKAQGVKIDWTRSKLNRLKEQTEKARNSGNESFWFKDKGEMHEILVAYAKYLIEYLETML